MKTDINVQKLDVHLLLIRFTIGGNYIFLPICKNFASKIFSIVEQFVQKTEGFIFE